MSFFAGLTAGIGEAQGQYNQKMLEFMNQKSNTMANLYGHLADTVMQSGDPYGIAPDLIDRSMKWTQAHPLFNPKGYKDLIKSEKGGLHDIVDRANQKQISDYHGMGSMSQPQSQGSPGFNPYQELPSGKAAGTQPAPAPEAPGTSTAQRQPGSPLEMPNLEDMMTQLTGGQPIHGPLGTHTPLGQMALSVVPEIAKRRMEMQDKLRLMESQFNTKLGGLDKRSPTGSAQYSEMMRAMGLNVPVTQWRNLNRMLYQDENGQYQVGPGRVSYRDGSTWVAVGPGTEREVTPIDENPKVTQAKDGSLWAETVKGPIRLGSGAMPIQSGVANVSSPGPDGTMVTSSQKQFTKGSSAQFPQAMPPGSLPSNVPTVGVTLPPGVNPGVTQGPPVSRTSVPRPSEAYKSQGGGFSLEKLETSKDPQDNQVAAYIIHPESFDLSGRDRLWWNSEFNKRTNGAVVQAPVPLKEFRTDFQKQRLAIVNGFNASRSISNILNSTDGAVVGFVAGKVWNYLNDIGSAKAISRLAPFFGSGGVDSQAPDFQPNPEFIKETIQKAAQENPALAHRLLTGNQDELAGKVADFITTTRLFNFADVKNTIGGVQGVSRVYTFLKSSLLNPGMDIGLVLGHLGSLNRNMADGLLALEQSRWGPKIPYIREKELMSHLYWDKHTEDLIKKYQDAAASKGSTLSRQDAIFYLWRNGKIEADPGNNVSVERVEGNK